MLGRDCRGELATARRIAVAGEDTDRHAHVAWFDMDAALWRSELSWAQVQRADRVAAPFGFTAPTAVATIDTLDPAAPIIAGTEGATEIRVAPTIDHRVAFTFDRGAVHGVTVVVGPPSDRPAWTPPPTVIAATLRGTTGRGRERAYLVAVAGKPPATQHGLAIVRSHDGGAHWDPPRALGDAKAELVFAQPRAFANEIDAIWRRPDRTLAWQVITEASAGKLVPLAGADVHAIAGVCASADALWWSEDGWQGRVGRVDAHGARIVGAPGSGGDDFAACTRDGAALVAREKVVRCDASYCAPHREIANAIVDIDPRGGLAIAAAFDGDVVTANGRVAHAGGTPLLAIVVGPDEVRLFVARAAGIVAVPLEHRDERVPRGGARRARGLWGPRRLPHRHPRRAAPARDDGLARWDAAWQAGMLACALPHSLGDLDPRDAFMLVGPYSDPDPAAGRCSDLLPALAAAIPARAPAANRRHDRRPPGAPGRRAPCTREPDRRLRRRRRLRRCAAGSPTRSSISTTGPPSSTAGATAPRASVIAASRARHRGRCRCRRRSPTRSTSCASTTAPTCRTRSITRSRVRLRDDKTDLVVAETAPPTTAVEPAFLATTCATATTTWTAQRAGKRVHWAARDGGNPPSGDLAVSDAMNLACAGDTLLVDTDLGYASCTRAACTEWTPPTALGGERRFADLAPDGSVVELLADGPVVQLRRATRVDRWLLADGETALGFAVWSGKPTILVLDDLGALRTITLPDAR